MMQQHTESEWQSLLLKLAVVLAALLVGLACAAVFYIFMQLVQRFGNVVLLFVMGAIVAYVLNPAVNRLTAKVGKRWVGTLVVYIGVAMLLAAVAASLLQPFLSQTSALVTALRNPSTSSLQVLAQIQDEALQVGGELQAQHLIATHRGPIPQNRVHRVQVDIAAMQNDLAVLEAPPDRSPSRTAGHRGQSPAQTGIRIPPSYLAPLHTLITALAPDYRRAVRNPAAPGPDSLARSISDAAGIASKAGALKHTVSTTPILLLDAQTWADQHHIAVNVQASAGQAVKKATAQAASLLNNTAALLSQTAALLLDFVLILIISVYFVSDGAHMVREAIGLVPDAYQKRATFFVSSADSVLGGYLRAQIFLALLAGVLGGVGSAVLGVPYAVVIGVSTFCLQLLPVIGPILVYMPPMIIALLFTNMPTPLILLAYFIVFEQVVTNVIGPRINSKSVGIHPLEAMAAALIGYPVAGFLGSFLAVPTVGLVHVLVREAHASRKDRASAPAAGNGSVAPAADNAGQAPSERTAASTSFYSRETRS